MTDQHAPQTHRKLTTDETTMRVDHPHCRLSRRGFLRAAGGSTAALFGAPFVSSRLVATASHRSRSRRPKVGVIMTTFFHRSHAHVLLENFLEDYYFNGRLTNPGVDVVSFYVDQLAKADMSKQVATDYSIPVFRTIREALTLDGDELAVDAVLLIGEHGEYGSNELGQSLYPRKQFFDEIVAVMKESNRFVPVFNDKHLSYRWDWAKEMYDTAQELGIPLMAGSSVPLAQRRPPMEIRSGAVIEEAVSIHGGGVEGYDFHALEVLQSMVEFRKEGETGVSQVQFLDHDALWKAADEGRWSVDLAEAAMRTEMGNQPFDLRAFKKHGEGARKSHGVLVQYRDGFRGLVVTFGRSDARWNFACRYQGDPTAYATDFYVGPWNNRNLFKALSHAIQEHFIHGQAPYPIERTLLVTGILDASMHSRHEFGKVMRTPQLEFGYKPIDFSTEREMGASWAIITEDTPEPEGINTNARRG